MTKYNAKKTTLHGIKFDSRAEAGYYLVLLEQQKKGLVKIIEIQPKIYMTRAKILYKADFLIEENGRLVYVDVKGMITPVFAIKKRLWLQYGLGTLRLVKKGKVISEIETVKNTRPID